MQFLQLPLPLLQLHLQLRLRVPLALVTLPLVHPLGARSPLPAAQRCLPTLTHKSSEIAVDCNLYIGGK